MVYASSLSPLCSLVSPSKPEALIARDSLSGKVFPVLQSSRSSQLQSLQVKAEPRDSNKSSKASNSIVCSDCEGNGAVQCSQCKGTGVNAVDHFNGRFKAGGLCWLCRGKRDILCGNCNGAGFIGGFMSTFDE